MQFYEKLIFLLNLTQSTNRMLARELQVDPSLISRLRTGTRGVPRNREHVKAMSSYFAKRCTTEYQMQALSEVLGIKHAYAMKKEQLSEILFYWLCGENDEVGRFMRTFDSLTAGDLVADVSVVLNNTNPDYAVYYGNNGKRAAARAVYQHLLTIEKPCMIYIMADESNNWISEDYEFSHNLQSWALNLINRGVQFNHIAPPGSPDNLAFDSLTRWMPIYMTGQVAAYFYPRLRDNVHRRTLVIIPGEIAMISSSIAGQPVSTATIITTERRLIQAYMTQFQAYLAMCSPMQNTYTEKEDLMQCFIRFLSLKGSRIQKVTSLSAETAPPELLAYCMEKIDNLNMKKLMNYYLQELDSHKDLKEAYTFIDIAYIASAEEVKSGNVPIILSFGDISSPIYYTPEIYILHLKNILRVMELNENYHFIPAPARMQNDGTIMVKTGQKALLVRTVYPPLPITQQSGA